MYELTLAVMALMKLVPKLLEKEKPGQASLI